MSDPSPPFWLTHFSPNRATEPSAVNLDKQRLQVMDLFRVLINKRPSQLCLIDQNSEEVQNLQSPEEEKKIGGSIPIG